MVEAALDFGRVGLDEGPDVVDAEFSAGICPSRANDRPGLRPGYRSAPVR